MSDNSSTTSGLGNQTRQYWDSNPIMKMARGQNRRLNCLNTRGVFCEWMITSFIIALWLIIETNVDRFRESDVWNSLVRGHIPVSGLGGSVCHMLLHPWTLSNWFVFFIALSLFLSFSLSFVHSRIWGKRAYIHEGFPIGLYFPLVSQNNLRWISSSWNRIYTCKKNSPLSMVNLVKGSG